MAILKMKNAKEWKEAPFEERKGYVVQITNILHSHDEGRKVKTFKPDNGDEEVENQWILFNGKIVSGINGEEAANKFVGMFIPLISRKTGEVSEAQQKKIADLYKHATGNEIPDEISTDQLFLDLQNKTVMTQVYIKKETKYSTNEAGEQIKERVPVINEQGYMSYEFYKTYETKEELLEKLEADAAKSKSFETQKAANANVVASEDLGETFASAPEAVPAAMDVAPEPELPFEDVSPTSDLEKELNL